MEGERMSCLSLICSTISQGGFFTPWNIFKSSFFTQSLFLFQKKQRLSKAAQNLYPVLCRSCQQKTWNGNSWDSNLLTAANTESAIALLQSVVLCERTTAEIFHNTWKIVAMCCKHATTTNFWANFLQAPSALLTPPLSQREPSLFLIVFEPPRIPTCPCFLSPQQFEFHDFPIPTQGPRSWLRSSTLALPWAAPTETAPRSSHIQAQVNNRVFPTLILPLCHHLCALITSKVTSA